jgi:hypothetical protein
VLLSKLQKRKEALLWSIHEASPVHPWRARATDAVAAGAPVTLGPLEIKTFLLTVN